MPTTAILGGGFGGLACARALRALATPDHRIVVVDRSPRFLVGATKTWVMLGDRQAPDVTRPRAALLPAGVECWEAEARSCDPATRRVETSRGALAPDYLVLALGADLDPDQVPGLAQAHSFYTLEGAARLGAALSDFRGGRLSVIVARAPFKCPPAPYEASLLLHAWLERHGLRARTRLDVWTVEKAPMPTAGPAMGQAIVAELSARDVGFHPLHKLATIDDQRHVARFENGAEASYDLLIAIPPHRVPRLVVEAGLAEPGGWVAVDPASLSVGKPGVAPHVYAIGDLASVPLPGRYDPATPLVLPKAGVFAAAQGEVVAARIAAAARGETPGAAFDGKGYCYLEVGDRLAMRADGSFFELPHPVMSARPADAAGYRQKIEWVEGWLAPAG